MIRQECPEDYDAVYRVIQEAFRNAEHTDGNEQDLAAELRKSLYSRTVPGCGGGRNYCGAHSFYKSVGWRR